jgi:pentatricopeptide repeat protein
MVLEYGKILQSKSRLLPGVIFFLLCYLYVWKFVKPNLVYHGFGTIITDVPLFSTGWRFLKDSLEIPGGLTFYVYGFLSQWYYYSWLGALIVVLVALCLFELSRQHYIHAGHHHSTILSYFPAIVIILIYNQYGHPLAACLASSVGLLFSYIFEKMPLRRRPIRMVVFCFMAAFCYCLAGVGGVLVFSLMTIIYLLFLRRDWLPAILTLPATAVIIRLLAEYAFHMSPKQAFLVLTPLSLNMTASFGTFSKISIVTLYVFVPATILLICLWEVLFRKASDAPVAHPKKTKINKKRATGGPLEAFTVYFIKKIVVPIAPIVVLIVGLYFSFDKIHRQIVLMNCLSRQGRWSEVLELANRMPKNIYNINCNHDINRALYRVGRLPYDMLCFPQNPHAFLLTHEKDESSMTQLKICDTYIELGNVDYAEKLASEFLVDKGCAVIVLEKLAWINIIKERENTARIYLNALKKDLIYRDRAKSMLHSLESGFKPDQVAYIHRINSYIRKNGNARLNKESIEEMLTGLLEHNPGNKMAFEYLMGCYLLAGQLDKIAENIGRLNQLGYQDVPTLYEEAMLIYYGSHGRKLNLKELNIKRETIERYKRFVQLCNSMTTENQQVALQRMMGEFGTSYFFYYYNLTTSRLAKTPQS